MHLIALSLLITVLSVAAQHEFAGTPHFKVDQFGYRPDDAKVMVISRARIGFNAGTEGEFTPGEQLEVRPWGNAAMGEAVLYSGAPHQWNNGALDSLSGDEGWWFDFSPLNEPGEYVVFDPVNALRSHPFRIATDVYDAVLKAAVKSLYYQRMNYAKAAPWAGAWSDGESHRQDTAALDLQTRTIPRDVTGGWMDAGDQNKYITFLPDAMHSLLIAWEENPQVFTDDFDIPESGNGVPDLIDALVWQLQWMVKMQDDDGGVFIKTGALDHKDPSPPSTDRRQRYYGPKCTSAGLVAASVFAHAALILRPFPLYAAFGDELGVRAMQAWEWVAEHRSAGGEWQTDCDAQAERIQSGNADMSALRQEEQAVTAAVRLFALTAEQRFSDYVVENYTKSELFGTGNWWGPYWIAFHDAMLAYTALPGADATVAQRVRSVKADNYATRDYYTVPVERALYRAWMPAAAFHWGHSATRANAAHLVLQSIRYGIEPQMEDHHRQRARQMLHWMHGVNALGKVYLTNVYHLGAQNCAWEIYHSWFAQGTRFQSALTGDGPAPGIVPGGPNAQYGHDPDDPARSWFGPHTVNLKPPYGQPPEKSYLDWGKGWNTQGCINNQCQEGSYAVTENSIGYQAAYIRLLSAFASSDNSRARGIGGSPARGFVPAGVRAVQTQSGTELRGLGGVRGTTTLFDMHGRVIGAASLDGTDRVLLQGATAAGSAITAVRIDSPHGRTTRTLHRLKSGG